MKRLLIISPYFPPYNAADMQRIRMSLPFFGDFNWEVEVVKIADEFLDTVRDPLLKESLPQDLIIHEVAAFSKKWTSKIGLGSIALRSLWFLKQKVDNLLKNGKYNLIYFSTTQFPVCILGAYWKMKFGIPYVIDMQDPWHSDYYQDKPKYQRPAKYWFSYRLNKYLEPIAMNKVDGLISVSEGYVKMLQDRYPEIKFKPTAIITFGAFDLDNRIMEQHRNNFSTEQILDPAFINIVYIGRGGHDMAKSLKILFKAFKNCLSKDAVQFSKCRFHFIGTSYASNGQGISSIAPIAATFGLGDFVEENTNRISFYHALYLLKEADGLLIPGSDDPNYTASKIYPYILAKRPLLAIFNENSALYQMLIECNAGYCAPLNLEKLATDVCEKFFSGLITNQIQLRTNWENFEKYSAREMTKKQCELFERVLNVN